METARYQITIQFYGIKILKTAYVQLKKFQPLANEFKKRLQDGYFL